MEGGESKTESDDVAPPQVTPSSPDSSSSHTGGTSPFVGRRETQHVCQLESSVGLAFPIDFHASY